MEKIELQPLPGPANLAFVEAMYQNFLRDPTSVSEDWRRYFADWGNGDRFEKPRLGPSFKPRGIFSPAPNGQVAEAAKPPVAAPLHDRVYLLIRLYRVRGHRIAQVNPLGTPQPTLPEFEPDFFGFTEAD